MAKFTWENFNGEFLSKVIYNQKTSFDYKPEFETMDVDMLIPYIVGISETPTRNFIIKYRTEIEFHLLKHQPEIVLEIAGATKGSNYLNELNILSKKKMTNSLADQYVKALYKIGGGEFLANEYSYFTNKRIVNLQTASNDSPISLYDFQKEALVALEKHYFDIQEKAGILVMPTGSGKTRTAVAFLLQKMVAKGYQVIWLTHRHMLIDQTAETFYKFSPAIKNFNSNKKKFSMVCVSGHHQTIKATEKTDDLMILSVQSTIRNLKYLKSVLGTKVIIVVDEAHHTYAKSYRKIIEYISSVRKNTKLLGLTATPIRTNDRESKYLLKLFDNHIIYSIAMSTLITKGILAKPEFESIETGSNFEATLSIDEAAYLKKWKELPKSLEEKISRSSERNSLIVRQYLNNQKKYGKTIVFALNGIHAFTLCQEFKKFNIKADFVYSNHTQEHNFSVINKFKDNDLDVLVNINILTEGSDIPDINTVFLTRPTSSDILLMQMIGRGMRGLAAKGTETVHIVDFCDQWDTFNNWLQPKWIIGLDSEGPPGPPPPRYNRKPNFIPWTLIKDIYNGLVFRGGHLQVLATLPYGWYSLLNEDEDYKIIVFKNQFPGYQKLFSDRFTLAKSGKPSAKALKNIYFNGFSLPPAEKDIEIFWNNVKNSKRKPDFFLFEEREQIEPFKVAEHIKNNKLYIFDYTKKIYDDFPIIKEIYGSFEKYNDMIHNIINYGQEPITENVIEEIPIELIPYTIDKPHCLETLFKEVKNEMFDGVYEGISSVTWTNVPMQSYYGVYYSDGSIKINMLLNSSQVNKEVIKYIIYHEMLHRDLIYHDNIFRALEHKYPNYMELERFLDYELSKFNLER